MTATVNPRGYAFVAFNTTYERQLRWRAMAAAKRYGYYPSRKEYIALGLQLFDRMYATATQDDATMRAMVTSIIKDMGQSIRAESYGHFKYNGGHGEPQYITTKHDVVLDAPSDVNDPESDTLGSQLTSIEEGYAKSDNDDVMKARLKLIATHMSDEDMNILTAYIDGDSFAAACEAKGINPDHFTKRIRDRCKGLKGMEVFA